MKRFKDLSEQEVLALAITAEEEDSRTYGEVSERMRQAFPGTSAIFSRMREEESNHRHRLIELYKKRFGEHIPLVKREDVRGFVRPKPVWLMGSLNLDQVRTMASVMEVQARQFYEKAIAQSTDASMRQLLGDLAEEERSHESLADQLQQEKLTQDVRDEEDEARRKLFLLQVVQPGLAGLMDGSVSTLAPLFAAAFATQNPHQAFLVGMAASVGAGISMGFAEAASDDGSLTGRGHPWMRGIVCGVMTTLGGVGHTLPYLIHDFTVATTVAVIIVVLELLAISYIRYKYMDTPFLNAAFQIIIGGILVFLSGILIGGEG